MAKDPTDTHVCPKFVCTENGEISAVGLEAEALEGCGVKKTMKELFISPESHIVFI